MNTIQIAVQLVTLAAAALVFWQTEPILNEMGRACKMGVRFAFWMLASGAAGLVVLIVSGSHVPPSVAAFVVGTAALLTAERRIRSLVRRRSSSRPQVERRS